MDNNITYISANIDVPNGCAIGCRVNARGQIEFSLGTWKGGIEIIFERHALQCFTELATQALNEPIQGNDAVARPAGSAGT